MPHLKEDDRWPFEFKYEKYNYSGSSQGYVLLGGRLFFQNKPMNGTRLGVIYDRRCSVLLKHGNAYLVESYEVKIRSEAPELCHDLICLTFDARDTGVAWLNNAIATSGSITLHIKALAHEMHVTLPEGAV